jgi:hypothetical protein
MTAASGDRLAMATIVAEARTIANEQTAWWQKRNDIGPAAVLYVLTCKRHQFVGWSEVWSYVYRWECRRLYRERQPQLMRRAA